VDFSWRSKVIV